jgi:hypothetical protein
MRFKITIGLAALALGGAFASGPAFAQKGVSGYSPDGGVVVIHPYRHHARPLFNVVPQRRDEQSPTPGRSLNDGGMSK